MTSGGILGTPSNLPRGWVLAGGFLVGPGANLDGAKLAGSTLKGVKSGGISGTPLSLPSGWSLSNGFMLGPYADLRNSTLLNINLDGVDLTHALLSGVVSRGIRGTPIGLPTGWSVVDGVLVQGAN